MRLFALMLFMMLAVAGMGISGVAPTLTKDRKLFADTEWVMEQKEKTPGETSGTEHLKL